jgi:hypothetical protein
MKAFSDAANERQFSKAIEMVKDGIPTSLLIEGHNPLTLLHDMLSDGIHELTDEECLEYATAVRRILVDLSERIAIALKETTELKEAVGKLVSRKSKDQPDGSCRHAALRIATRQPAPVRSIFGQKLEQLTPGAARPLLFLNQSLKFFQITRQGIVF